MSPVQELEFRELSTDFTLLVGDFRYKTRWQLTFFSVCPTFIVSQSGALDFKNIGLLICEE